MPKVFEFPSGKVQFEGPSLENHAFSPPGQAITRIRERIQQLATASKATPDTLARERCDRLPERLKTALDDWRDGRKCNPHDLNEAYRELRHRGDSKPHPAPPHLRLLAGGRK